MTSSAHAPVAAAGDDAEPDAAQLALVDRFKSAFRDHPAGVAIVTADSPDGPVGLTASSVASVSVEPPALVFSVTRATGSAGAILGADTFVVHLLRDEHAALAQSFARSGAPRFTEEQGWLTRHTGEPVLPGATVAIRCRALRTVPVGGSTVIIAEVLDIDPGVAGNPLVYHGRVFHSLGEHSILP